MIILFKFERTLGGETVYDEHLTWFPLPEGYDASKLGEEFLWDVLAVERHFMAEDLHILEVEYVED